jgi:hypothetical protein
MHGYIAASIPRRDSNIFTNWGMVDDVAGVLPSVFFELLLEIVRKMAKQLAWQVGGATMVMH